MSKYNARLKRIKNNMPPKEFSIVMVEYDQEGKSPTGYICSGKKYTPEDFRAAFPDAETDPESHFILLDIPRGGTDKEEAAP